MDPDVNGVALAVFIFLFALVTGLGFVASGWKRAEDPENLDEWGLGGRKFGSWVTWFLVGGDLYTAYTFVAVPALMFGVGALLGGFLLNVMPCVFPILSLKALSLARAGESETASKTSLEDISSGRRGGLRSHRGEGGRTRDQLYAEAAKANIKGRSRMTKAQLERAVGR